MIDNSWDGKKAGMILHKHISNRHVAQNMLEKVAQNTEYSPPNEHLRIKRLLKSIISRGIIIVSTVTVIKVNDVIGEKLNVFEDAVDFLIMMVSSPFPARPRHLPLKYHQSRPLPPLLLS